GRPGAPSTFFYPSRNRGCPTLRGFCEGWDATLSTPVLPSFNVLPSGSLRRDKAPGIVQVRSAHAPRKPSAERWKSGPSGPRSGSEGISTTLPQAFGAKRQDCSSAPFGCAGLRQRGICLFIRFNAALKLRSSTCVFTGGCGVVDETYVHYC